ncbi:hypothetical protein [Herbiconiux sp.]|uniref:hypothetical protein n=1 Tax=Herbiconiux sp. TaxID=1871186 RepID=UPI0025C21FE7|nr:hypothetical protein [Herbiconiux sp.]
MDACAELCSLLERLAGAPDGHERSPRGYLREVGRQTAGIRLGPLWAWDAIRGGRNRLPGTGFAAPFDDSTRGQARHFGGIVAVAARIGPRLARWGSIHIGRDRPDTPDGRLSDAAIEFARLVTEGRLVPADAAGWLRGRLCAPGAAHPPAERLS